jgi:CHAT domain
MMASATLKVFALDNQRGGYPAELSQDGKPKVAGLLPTAAFSSGKWRVAVDPNNPPPAGDIVAIVVATEGKDRPNIDWPELTGALFDLLFPVGPLRDAYLKFARDTELFLDIDPPELARVPWELAQSSKPSRFLPLNYSLSRLHSAVPGDPASDWPFRILILVGCTEEEEKEDLLGVASEVAQIRRGFLPYGRSVDVHICKRPTWDQLKSLIEGDDRRDRWEPHVLHFVGHTALSGDGTVGLRIESARPGGAMWVWSEKALQVQLPLLNWVPQFVFLNACRTGDDPLGAWSMQRSFIDAGTQCVVTMQADVNGTLAGLFASKLYEKVAAGSSIQKAMRDARTAIYAKQQGGDLIDWALPSLSAASTKVDLFKPRPAPNDPEYATCEEFSDARVFANCDDARRLLTHWICPARLTPPNPKQANVVMLTGKSKSGKSHLLKWAMESWLIGNARVRYIELHDGTARGFLSVLRQIRDGDGKNGTRLLQRRLPTSAFKRFNWTLKNLLTNGRPGEWIEAAHPAAEIADDFSLELLPAMGEERLEPAICGEFFDALKKAAEDKPLVLVFDKFTDANSRLVSPDDFAQIVTHLFKSIALEKDGLVKLVFCANAVERETYKLTELPQPLVYYDVPADFHIEELVQYAVDMVRFDPKAFDEATVADNQALLKAVADALLRLPSGNPETAPQGIARLSKLTEAFPPDWISAIERMQ